MYESGSKNCNLLEEGDSVVTLDSQEKTVSISFKTFVKLLKSMKVLLKYIKSIYWFIEYGVVVVI